LEKEFAIPSEKENAKTHCQPQHTKCEHNGVNLSDLQCNMTQASGCKHVKGEEKWEEKVGQVGYGNSIQLTRRVLQIASIS